MASGNGPLPVESLTRIANGLFSPLGHHDCTLALFVAGGGKRTLLQYFLQEKTFLRKAIGKESKNLLLVFVNPDKMSDTTNEAFLKLMQCALEERVKSTSLRLNVQPAATALDGILDTLRQITALDQVVAFILNDFEITLSLSPSIYRNLEVMMAVKKSNIMYMFCSSTNILSPEYIDRFHNLKYALTQHVYYHTLLGSTEFTYVLRQIATRLRLKLTPSQKKVLSDITGGHPQLLKYALGILSQTAQEQWVTDKKLSEFLLSQKQLHIVCNDVWEQLTTREREIMLEVMKTGTVPRLLAGDSEFLLHTGLIRRSASGRYETFGSLCKAFLLAQIHPEKLTYNPTTDQLFYGVQNCTNRFTLQEFKVLAHLVGNQGKVVSRDEVGQVLWGKNYFEKYSDWMIDKIISTIRKKLTQIGYDATTLVTLKKRGFSLG